MKTQKKLLSIDLVIQIILFFGTSLAALGTLVSLGAFGIFLGYALLLLGGWQLGSGVIMGIILKDNLRAKYFFGSVFYLLMIFGLGNILLNGNKFAEIFFASIFIVTIPLCIAFWYLKLTKSTITELEKKIEIPEDMRDVLDSEEIFTPIEKQ